MEVELRRHAAELASDARIPQSASRLMALVFVNVLSSVLDPFRGQSAAAVGCCIAGLARRRVKPQSKAGGGDGIFGQPGAWFEGNPLALAHFLSVRLHHGTPWASFCKQIAFALRAFRLRKCARACGKVQGRMGHISRKLWLPKAAGGDEILARSHLPFLGCRSTATCPLGLHKQVGYFPSQPV